ncbi:MAG: hypothetical protein J7525_19750 [Roseofilum sp. SID3]|uniref:hypothetical protein n=1 Tax=Roseofilum sp. SID3 TaxID=2821499 RepID=UPI001B238CBC|nr:hypothetical protein [Roseofilum sp. SID3]MBP0015331.1 hypothetical protein [Roseofilum sp. SID3]
MKTVINYHRDHTYARAIAWSWNIAGSGKFSIKSGEEVIKVDIQPGDVIRFNCKKPHKFEKHDGCRVGLFGWELNEPKGYGVYPDCQKILEDIDREIAQEFTLAFENTYRQMRDPVEKIYRIGEANRKQILEYLRQYKEYLRRDNSTYTSDRLIKWFGVEPDLRFRDGTVNQATIDRRLLKFVRRFDRRANVLLLGVNY